MCTDCYPVRTLEGRVDAGIKALDRRYGPDWDKHINLGSLDIAEPEFCVLGQIAGYNAVAWKLQEQETKSVFAMGFAALTDEYPRLNEIWREKIQQRRLDRVPAREPAVATKSPESALV